MGTIPNSGRPAAFQNQIHPNGLDLGRCVINSALGIYQAAEAAEFLAGYAVMLDSASKVVVSDATKYLGIAKWNKTTKTYGRIVEEVIMPQVGVPVHLRHSNVSHVRVVVQGTGNAATLTTDYTISEVNGTITAVASGALDETGPALVTYTYLITEAMLAFQGRNFWNFLNEVSIHDNFVTVITDAELLFTTAYDSSAAYVPSGGIYISGTQSGQTAGEMTSVATGSKQIGETLFPPTADDIFLGWRPVKGPKI